MTHLGENTIVWKIDMSNHKINEKYLCISCSSSELEMLEGYSSLPRVTSDCKPDKIGGEMGVCHFCGLAQKIFNAKLLQHINDIYDNYEMYDLDQDDQIIFGNGADVTRTQIIVQCINDKFNLPKFGKLLEIGASKGAFLKNFGKEHSEWSLYSKEYDAKYAGMLEKIPNFKKNYTKLEQIKENTYDLVVAIHTLEHLHEPREYIQECIRNLSKGSPIFIQVPNIDNSIFDLLVSDHIAHFTDESLKIFLNSFGIKSDVFSITEKELSGIMLNDVVGRTLSKRGGGVNVIKEKINQIIKMKTKLEMICEKSNIAVYGTTIAANWIRAVVGDRIFCFIDDDKMKIGKTLGDRPIYAIADIPNSSKLVLPFNHQVNNKIIQKNAIMFDNKKIEIIELQDI